MFTPRRAHVAVFHTPHLYILGGVKDSYLSECERHLCAENRWEALLSLELAAEWGRAREQSLCTRGI
jgi:hypothetical protein